jgi:hypothetical protein
MGMGNGKVSNPQLKVSTISGSTFKWLNHTMDECITAEAGKPGSAPQHRNAWCRAFVRAVSEGEKHKDLAGLDRLEKFSPGPKFSKSLATAIAKVDNEQHRKALRNAPPNIPIPTTTLAGTQSNIAIPARM